ncbi:MAG: 30S ribosomal protein S8 [Candidatus Jacksonbacteria bacterium RIFOXYC2_FULL_44_29]|nr:MAG: 30S ribosomal protein S8 [Parcubacteria group bacterium GW2011_GWA2_42_28]KKT56220.1 MAG: 30S ribosomal protein S8 [Parcubacteria group bacterium GW2011_GWC2_44_22]OGY76132.1 MAG: 30S ribosomal protein S8 [Candidatus Jacksonbacteria bacterium RIFOXYA2_FULL_43_12]OGY77723.1 MAG: 30S ribosomal protein S8 [Candidatus Jacksonbacteria bacterium RIFOXYB2_FULL_44_15]OGY78859.1 MAG: 30S ribosomal protein S8 [Candidatus Jacksonbacteria bacterium RIFOXYD2_FULL_43_21]OGY80199.1 MAG: 30S ribosomal
MHSDPIADMLNRIQNSLAVKKAEVEVPLSKLSIAVLTLLKNYDYLKNFTINSQERSITVQLAYDKNGRPRIKHIKKISKPGRRLYCSANTLPKVLNNLGIAVISTDRGLITNKEARRAKVGGEIICEIY